MTISNNPEPHFQAIGNYSKTEVGDVQQIAQNMKLLDGRELKVTLTYSKDQSLTDEAIKRDMAVAMAKLTALSDVYSVGGKDQNFKLHSLKVIGNKVEKEYYDAAKNLIQGKKVIPDYKQDLHARLSKYQGNPEKEVKLGNVQKALDVIDRLEGAASRAVSNLQATIPAQVPPLDTGAIDQPESVPTMTAAVTAATEQLDSEPSAPPLKGVGGTDPGRLLTRKMETDGEVHATEEIERYKSVEDLRVIVEKRKETLSQILRENPEMSPDESRLITGQIKRCEVFLQEIYDSVQGESLLSQEQRDKLEDLGEKIRESPNGSPERQALIAKRQAIIDAGKRDWLGSNYVRDKLALAPLDQVTLDQGVKAYEKTAGRILPALVNARDHRVLDAEGNKQVGQSILRWGVLTDMSNGYTDLNEMQLMLADSDKREAKKAELKKLLEKAHPHPEGSDEIASREAIVLKYAINQLESAETLQAAFDERIQKLEFAMVDMIQKHLENGLGGSESYKHGDTIPFMNVSLLNHLNEGVDSTGLKKHEGRFMEDMAFMYKRFENRPVVYDGAGPYIDKDGVVHMSKKILTKNNEPKTVKILPMFTNISVQGHTTNDGIQRELNVRGLEVLEKYLELKRKEVLPEFLAIRERLEAGESNFEVARELGLLMQTYGISTSINCMSAKDRTGVLCASLALNKALERVPSGKVAEVRKKLGREMLDLALKVAQDCNNAAIDPRLVLALKTTAFSQLEFSEDDMLNVRRIAEYVKFFGGMGVLDKVYTPLMNRLGGLFEQQVQAVEQETNPHNS